MLRQTRLRRSLRLQLKGLAQLPLPLLRLLRLLRVWARLLLLLRKRRLDLVQLLFLRLRLLRGLGQLPFPLLRRLLPVWEPLGLWEALRQLVLERLPARLYLLLRLGPKG